MSFFLKCNLMRHSRKRIQWLVHVDTTQLYLNHEIMLSRVQLPDAGNSGETLYELKPLKQPRDMEVVLVKKRRWKGQEICIRAPSSARGSSSPLNLCAVSVVWSEKQYLSLIISHLLGWVKGCYSIQQYLYTQLGAFSSQEPRSFWPAAGIESSGRTRFSEHAQSIRFIFSANKICQIWREVRESRTSGVGQSQSSRSLPQVRRIVALGTRVNWEEKGTV